MNAEMQVIGEGLYFPPLCHCLSQQGSLNAEKGIDLS
jgi:hypothetical protein